MNIRNSVIKKHISVYELTRMERIYDRFPHGGKDVSVPKHVKGDVDFWNAKFTTKPKISYTILRIAKARAGQLELFPVLNKKIKRSKKAKRLMYV